MLAITMEQIVGQQEIFEIKKSFTSAIINAGELQILKVLFTQKDKPEAMSKSSRCEGELSTLQPL